MSESERRGWNQEPVSGWMYRTSLAIIRTCFPQGQETTGKLEDKNYVSVIELIIHVIGGRNWFLSPSIRLGGELSVVNCTSV